MRKETLYNILICFSVFSATLGAKLCLIRHYGTDLPHWDQWLGEGSTSIKPWIEGKLSLLDLFSAHNEHRIALTRLFCIALTWLNMQWDSLLEMVINSSTHALFAVLLWVMLFLGGTLRASGISALLVIGVFSLPYNWENTLLAFQSQLYLMLLLSVSALWLCCSNALSRSWLAGFTLVPLAVFTQSSGFIVAAAATVPLFIQVLREKHLDLRVIVASALLLGLIALGFYLRVEVSYHASLKAHSLKQFAFYFLQVLGWPVRGWSGALFSFIHYAPVTVLGYLVITGRVRDKRSLFIVSLGAWVAIQALATAYARGGGRPPIPSRYTDTLSIGFLANLAAMTVLVARHYTKTFSLIGASWLSFFVAVLMYGGLTDMRVALPEKARFSKLGVENTRAYVATGDFSYLAGKPELYVPFLFPHMLAEFVDAPALRQVLPSSIAPPLQAKENLSTDDTFQPGAANPFVPPMPAEPIWGSFSKNGEKAVGSFRSELQEPPILPFLEVLISGYLPLPHLELKLVGENGAELAHVQPGEVARESWKRVYVSSPRTRFRIEATDNREDSWFAFSGFRGVGRYGLYARKVIDLAEWLLCIGLLLPLGIVCSQLLSIQKTPHVGTRILHP